MHFQCLQTLFPFLFRSSPPPSYLFIYFVCIVSIYGRLNVCIILLAEYQRQYRTHIMIKTDKWLEKYRSMFTYYYCTITIHLALYFSRFEEYLKLLAIPLSNEVMQIQENCSQIYRVSSIETLSPESSYVIFNFAQTQCFSREIVPLLFVSTWDTLYFHKFL